ncbi:MAG: AI-2E family transporter [Ruminococcus sp.]|nr:AI-2E family transporter [Ruminococcus sp.]
MNRRKDKKFQQTLAIVVAGVLLYWGLTNYKVVGHWIGLLVEVLSSFIIGFVIALILNVPMSFIERKLFRPRKDGKERGKLFKRLSRPVSIALTYLLCLGVIAAVIALLVPSIRDTFSQLYAQVPDFIVRVFNTAKNNPTLNEWIENADLSADEVINTLSEKLSDTTIVSSTLSGVFSFVFGTVTGVVNFFLGVVFSIYMLLQKEKLKDQLYRFTMAVFPERVVKELCYIGNLSKAKFSSFLSGQGLEACILGSLCAIGMKAFGFPYAATIGLLVAVTAFIPIAGAFIGAGVGALLIMITSFKKALLFVLFIIVLQQIEGNLIYPKVVGKSVELPGIWVLFAVTIGGNIGGIFGMFIAVPICSIVYTLLGEMVAYLSKRKEKDKDISYDEAGSEV